MAKGSCLGTFGLPLAIITGICLFGACDLLTGADSGEDDPGTLTSCSAGPDQAGTAVGQIITLSGSIEGTSRSVTYKWEASASNPSVVSLSNSGSAAAELEVTGDLAVGEYEFTLTADNGVTSVSDSVVVSLSAWEKLLPPSVTDYDYCGASGSLSSDGTVALVGSYGDGSQPGGAVYVYRLSDSGWVLSDTLTAEDAAAGDHFGFSLQLSPDGNTAFVGATGDAGAVYVFTYDGTSWAQTQKLTASDGASGDYFGYSLAITPDSSLAVIGAWLDDDNGTDSGSVYIFSASGGIWSQSDKLVPDDGAANDNFGASVACCADGSTLLIGSRCDDDAGSNSGSAYVFSRIGRGWYQSAKLMASDAGAGDSFSKAIALSSDGSTAVISAWVNDEAGSDAGAVYVFTGSDSTWTEQRQILPSDDEVDYGNFGRTISLSEDGSLMLVGGEYRSVANLYQGSGSSWSLKASLPTGGFQSVALSGDGKTALTGSWSDSENGTRAGAAFAYQLDF